MALGTTESPLEANLDLRVTAGSSGSNGGGNATGVLPNERPLRAAGTNDQSDVAISQILLVADPPIGGDQHVEARLFGGSQQSTDRRVTESVRDERFTVAGDASNERVSRRSAEQPPHSSRARRSRLAPWPRARVPPCDESVPRRATSRTRSTGVSRINRSRLFGPRSHSSGRLTCDSHANILCACRK